MHIAKKGAYCNVDKRKSSVKLHGGVYLGVIRAGKILHERYYTYILHNERYCIKQRKLHIAMKRRAKAFIWAPLEPAKCVSSQWSVETPS